MPDINHIFYGSHSVEKILQSKKKSDNDKLFISRNTGKKLERILQLASLNGIKATKLMTNDLNKMAKTSKHQGVVLIRQRSLELKRLTEEQILDSERREVFVALDGVTDPQNVGAIARSMVAFDAKGLIVTKKKGARLDASAIKTSAGALLNLPILQTGGIAGFINNIKKKDASTLVLTTDVSGEALSEFRLHDYDYSRLILVMGSEGEGVSGLVKKRSDALIKIFQSTQVQSLNVSNATAIMLHHFYNS